MQFRADDYYNAAIERMREAQELYRNGRSYSLTMYCSGLAVECLLRAFRWRVEQTFEGRHDLVELFQASRLQRIDDDYLRRKSLSEESLRVEGRKLRTALNDVVLLWHNNLRYASEARLKKFLSQIHRLQGVKGDPLKKNALDLFNAARMVVDRGIVLWTSRTRS